MERRKHFFRTVLFAIAAPAVASCSGASSLTAVPALPSGAARALPGPGALSWKFTTIENPNDGSYNELSGINNQGKITGFSGNGTTDLYRGYVIYNYGRGRLRAENYPSAYQTVLTSDNNSKAIAGWYVPKQHKRWVFGCIDQGGIWTSYRDLNLNKYKTNITKLMGINDAALAVGYYTDDQRNDHAFELDASTGKFHDIVPPGAVSAEATGINGKGDVVGFMKLSDGSIKSWFLKGGHFTAFAYPQSRATQALAVNWQDQIVGAFIDSSGRTHGFLMGNLLGSPSWKIVDEPNAKGKTVVTSIENFDYLVGYYRANAKGTISGFLATPKK